MTAQKKDLRVFMRESAKIEEIITVPGPESIKDEDGKIVNLEIKVLNSETLQKINDKYKRRSIATDKKGNPYIVNNEVAFQTEQNFIKATQHIIVEALVYPDLKDKALMEYYNCFDITEMPKKVFPKADEYSYVSKMVMSVLGISGEEPTQEEKEEALEEAKN